MFTSCLEGRIVRTIPNIWRHLWRSSVQVGTKIKQGSFWTDSINRRCNIYISRLLQRCITANMWCARFVTKLSFSSLTINCSLQSFRRISPCIGFLLLNSSSIYESKCRTWSSRGWLIVQGFSYAVWPRTVWWRMETKSCLKVSFPLSPHPFISVPLSRWSCQGCLWPGCAVSTFRSTHHAYRFIQVRQCNFGSISKSNMYHSLSELDAYMTKLEDEKRLEAQAASTSTKSRGKAVAKTASTDKVDKRKAPKASQGVEKLKKANINGMSKLSTFFTKK